MAHEIVKRERKSLTTKDRGAIGKHAKKAAKKHAKKAAKHAGERTAGLKHGPQSQHGPAQGGLRTAFHHMQRASVVISLMEKGSGQDLRDLLERGVKLYEHALEGKGGDETTLKAIGVLRAAEHLSLAGLYAARHKHRQKVDEPKGPWLKGFMAETHDRLKRVEEGKRGKGPDLFPVAAELVRQARDSDDDPHLAFELVMAADALCFALENGL